MSDESDWIRNGPDLAALGRGTEHGWLNTFLEDTMNKISTRLTMASAVCFEFPPLTLLLDASNIVT